LALSLSNNDFDIRLSLLLHDIGKPFSYQDGKVRHFHNHNIISYEMSIIILERLNYNEEFINKISYLILNHDHPISSKQIKDNYNLSLKLYEIQKCDALAHHPDMLEKRINYLNNVEKKLVLIKKEEGYER
jgi:CRISPR/Cas system-associated endonuclease Cas3-HD